MVLPNIEPTHAIIQDSTVLPNIEPTHPFIQDSMVLQNIKQTHDLDYLGTTVTFPKSNVDDELWQVLPHFIITPRTPRLMLFWTK